MTDVTTIAPPEAIRLGALSLRWYGKLFFPSTYRQDSPGFHDDVGAALYNPAYRHVAFKIFRGGAKTTILRVFTSQRVAYAVSRTILFVSLSQAHSMHSTRWLKRQFLYNHRWRETFNLRQGSKWTDEILEFYHGTEEVPITVIALGITGQIRGVNIDDYRPDLIVVDDPCDLENTSTPEQRAKTDELMFGALEKSLAPWTEAPLAKMALLQTPQNEDDVIEKCSRDPEWHTVTYGCFDENGRSRWEARFPTEVLQKEKMAHIHRNQLALWMREMECKLVKSERKSFNIQWLRYWDVLPDNMVVIVPIDPASSDEPKADKQAAAALGFSNLKLDTGRSIMRVFLLEYRIVRGDMPDELCNWLFDVIMRWHPRKLVVEKVAYQRVLAWIIEREMRARRIWIPVERWPEKGTERRSKADRIIQSFAHSGLAPYGNFYCRKEHTEFIQQFVDFAPDVEGEDDLIDCIAIGLASMNIDEFIEGEYEDVTDDERKVPQLERFRGCP